MVTAKQHWRRWSDRPRRGKVAKLWSVKRILTCGTTVSSSWMIGFSSVLLLLCLKIFGHTKVNPASLDKVQHLLQVLAAAPWLPPQTTERMLWTWQWSRTFSGKCDPESSSSSPLYNLCFHYFTLTRLAVLSPIITRSSLSINITRDQRNCWIMSKGIQWQTL